MTERPLGANNADERTLSSIEQAETNQHYIESRLPHILSELESLQINVPGHPPIDLMDQLRQLPRSGHMLRIERYNLDLPKQSVHDHVTVLAPLADLLKGFANLSIEDQELIANCIASHDLAELIIGDVPDFTPPELAEKILANRISDNEQEAENLIAGSMSDDLSARYKRSNELLSNTEHPLTKFFLMVDKTEPILSMWRYMKTCHDQIEIEAFLAAMTDFFTNPRVTQYATHPEVVELVTFLQNPDNARKFYHEGVAAFSEDEATLLIGTFLNDYIEKIPMVFVQETE